jgi:hypothetical protein
VRRDRRKKTEHQRKQEAKAKAARELEATKKRLGLGESGPLRGATPSPLEATPHRRAPNLEPTSDRIPGFVPARDLLHAHRWKRGAEETTETVKAMRRKTTQSAPAYNKGGLQYLPGGLDKDQWPSRQEQPTRRK